jgi:class 3 adenylate cyclase
MAAVWGRGVEEAEMARTTPHVEQATLTLGLPGAEQAIAVGSPAWFTWLSTATAFTFACPEGTFTARRERASSGRGGWYWRAEQRRGGVRRRAYLGKAEELTLAQLHAVAATLASADAQSYTPARRLAEAAAPVDAVQALAALPTGTATFLFTDIESSTQLWEQHPQAMRAALARHDILMRQAIDAHSGAVFKTVGDSVYAAFSRAPDALAAALAAQRALHQEAWDLPTPLRVRMALHTGAAEPQGGDYVGPPLNRLARLLTLGHGGRILLSRATHDLVADDLPSQTSLRALGDYHLKDLTRPEPIYQCLSADLPADFPPLRASEPDTGGVRKPGIPLLATKLYIPRARPTLLLRPRLLARLDASLAGGRYTLLSAPAGAGKTSLLATWLARVGRPVAWLALDEHDHDAHQLLRYLIAALQIVAPSCGRTALAWLDAPPSPPPETILTPLVNDLAALPAPCLLVLDDYHLVRAPAIHAVLAFLLDHLPPAVHLVIATREDPPLPLPRLRARGQLTEVRAADLRFTPEEAAAFMDTSMGLHLPEEQWRRWPGAPRAGRPGCSWPASRYATGPTRRHSWRPSPAATGWWPTTWRPRCSTASQLRCGASCWRVACSTGYARRYATPCWPATAKRQTPRPPPATARRSWRNWSGPTCSWCRWTTSGAGIATTTCSPTCCAPG